MSHNPQQWTPEFAKAAQTQWSCPKCQDTGTIDTGNNDLACDCEAGDRALFNNAFVTGGPITGAEAKRHFYNDSPKPITYTISVGDLRKGNFSVASRILVVDDDEQNLKFITGLLVVAGYGVVQARDGREGLHTFRHDDEGFALVLSDWLMPNMRGSEMLRRIRRETPSQRVLMMSSNPDDARKDLKKFHTVEGVRVLDKGFDPHQIENAVRNAIEAPIEPTH